MVRLDLAAVLLAVTARVTAVTANTPSVVPGAYIVEYEEDQVRALSTPLPPGQTDRDKS